MREDLYVRSIAMANDDVVVAVDFKDAAEEDMEWFWLWLVEQQLIVFNVMYDHGIIYNKTGKLVKPLACMYTAFKFLGGKKYSDSAARHSLKWAQTELLGWEQMGNDEIKTYMKDEKLTWEDVEQFDEDILLHYNGLDADATWSLYLIVKNLVRQNWDTWGEYFSEWHQDDCLTISMLWIESLQEGLPIDQDQLVIHHKECVDGTEVAKEEFFAAEEVAGGILEYNQKAAEAMRDAPMKNKFKKNGEPTKHWANRLAKYEENIKLNHFNLNSPPQLKWLLYEYAKLVPPKPTGSTDKESLGQLGHIGDLILNYRSWNTELKFAKQLVGSNNNGVLYPNVVFPGTDTGRVVSREEIAE